MDDFQEVDITKMADFIELYCKVNEIVLTHLKLQKVLYYIQSWHLAYFKKDIFKNVQPEAWVNGPVYRSIYSKYYGMRIYDGIISPRDFTPDETEKLSEALSVLKLNNEQIDFLNAVLEYYCTKTNEELIIMTHREPPWNEARKGLGPFDYSDNKISLDLMKEYYSSRIKN